MIYPWRLGELAQTLQLQESFKFLFSQGEGIKINREDGPVHLELAPGQIIAGKVLQFAPNQRAWIQLGGKFKVFAQVNLPLTVGQLEWFQVEKADGPVVLKVITSPKSESKQPTIPDHWQTLLRWLGAEETEDNFRLVRRLVDTQLPLNRPLFRQIEQTLALVGRGEREEEAVLWAVQKGWPPTPAVIRSLLTFWHGPDLVQLLTTLKEHLPPAYQGSWQSLVEQLPITQLNPQNIKQYLQQIVFPPHKDSKTEGMPFATTDSTNLPVLIQTLLKDPSLNSSAKKLAEQVFAYLAGQELTFRSENWAHPVAYLFFQLMIRQEKGTDTVYAHLEGQRNGEGKVSKEHCRLLLYAQLKNLKETCLDVLIHQKWISIKIFNDLVHQSWIEEARPLLEEGLAELGYQLSSLSVKKWDILTQPLPQKNPSIPSYRPYQGVDIRI